MHKQFETRLFVNGNLKTLEVLLNKVFITFQKMLKFLYVFRLTTVARSTRASGSGSSRGTGHCVVFLGKTLYSHSASLHPGV